MRNLHFWFAVGLGALIAAFTFASLRVALSESLWLDELHTSWAVSGPWQEIASRAAAGNQTPLYFWLVGLLTQTLGQQSEWILRLPSTAAWLLALVLVGWHIRAKASSGGAKGWLFALCIVAWIALDRLQWFYATEARPYACVQLISLAGWCCVEALVTNEGQSVRQKSKNSKPHTPNKLILVWCLLSIVNIYLHLTAALPVMFQWLMGGWLVWRQKKSQTAVLWAFAALGVVLAVLPILELAFPVWQRRAQWATFASDVSLSKATSMFPFVPILLSVLVGWSIDRGLRGKAPIPSESAEVKWLWWTAMLGPWLCAWALAATGIAPMFHERFVLSSALPLYIVGAIVLLSFKYWTMRWITCLAVAVAIVFSQVTVTVWRAGFLVGNLRGEDWRAATQWVSERIEPDEPLLCFSRLIEASSSPKHPIDLPLDAKFAEYLSFPLLGVYRIRDHSSQAVSVTPLLEDHHRWATQVLERLGENPDRSKSLWLVYRGAPGRLKTRVTEFQADMRQRNIVLEASEPTRFGSLYVVEFTQ